MSLTPIRATLKPVEKTWELCTHLVGLCFLKFGFELKPAHQLLDPSFSGSRFLILLLEDAILSLVSRVVVR